MIDPALLRAGWDVTDPAQVGIEVPVEGPDAEPWNGVTDYCLYRADGQVLAVVEAKKQARDPNVAREQTRRYVLDIAVRRAGGATPAVSQTFAPFAFFSNGLDTYFWDVEAASPRLVASFFSPSDLENLLFQRLNAQPLAQTPINPKIASRLYQHEAIRRVVEAFDAGKRRALLVMATGTGKTRTTVALVDLFLRANQARRILFLADRDALVDQALQDGFKAFLPDEPRRRIWAQELDLSQRLYVATLQTMSRCFDQYSPGFFDLIIFDEAHRSVYSRLGEMMPYFDGRMIGLTATPADFLERDTFRLFGCNDKTPTFLYSYKQAVDEGYLVDFSLYQAQTGFQRPHCTFNLNPRPSSIDTPLHSFVPQRHVDHTHPNAAISVAASKNSDRLTHVIYGDDVIHTHWLRPGFELGLVLQDITRRHPDARGVILGQHGLINWASGDRDCYYLSLDLIEKAASYIEARDKGEKTFGGAKYQRLEEGERRRVFAQILPWLRGQVSWKKRLIGTIQEDDAILRFVNSMDAPRLAELGTSCPDHFLRTKIKPLYVAWDPQTEDAEALKEKLTAGLQQYRADYAAYYDANKRPGSPAMRDPNPTVVLVPGLGMIAWGKDKSESRVTAEFYNCAVEVMRGAEAIDEYVSLPAQEAFDIEYWLLEEAKLQRMPPEKEMARQVVAVVGAGSGIGRELAHRLVRDGAHVACLDVNADAAAAAAKEIMDKVGMGIGVAGSGISGCGQAVGIAANITDRHSIRTALEQVTLAYGGFDSVAVTAGIFVSPDTSGHIDDDKWALTFAINVTGSYLVADEAAPLWRAQGLTGKMVITTSANAVVSKKGSVAYDTSKAAANHLVRELAVELAPLVRVNGVAPATVVQGSAMFPRGRVIASLAKYALPYSESESDDVLQGRLAQFYAERTLTKTAITPSDQAEALFLLLSDRLSKTTGQILSVDGGLHEAFLR